MSPAPQNSGADWVKWVAGLALSLNGIIFGYAISIERRQSTTETALSSHIIDAKESKAIINSRLDRSDESSAKVLQGISAVQVDVAKITGYLEQIKATKDK